MSNTIYQVILKDYKRNRGRLHNTIKGITGFPKKVVDDVIDKRPTVVIATDSKTVAMDYLRELQNAGAISRVATVNLTKERVKNES